MSPNISGVVRAKATIEATTTAEVFNVNLAIANTEYSHTFSTSTKSNKLIIRKKKDCIISMRKKALKICPTRDIFHNGFINPCNYVLLLAF